MKPIVRSLIAGALWGIVAAGVVIGLRWYVAVGIFVSGPFIGVAVYWVSQWSYRSRFSTILWTVPSVIVAAIIFGLVVGLLDSIERGSVMIGESMVASMWAIISPSPFWLLYPLALTTHLWVRVGSAPHRENRDMPKAI
jgi:hypothetical protein